MSVISWSAVPKATPRPGVRLRSRWLEGVMVSRIELDAGVDLPDHAHAAEQIGTVLEGTMTFRLEGATTPVAAGDSYCVASQRVHGGRAGPGGCVLLESFSPVRPEYVALAGG